MKLTETLLQDQEILDFIDYFDFGDEKNENEAINKGFPFIHIVWLEAEYEEIY